MDFFYRNMGTIIEVEAGVLGVLGIIGSFIMMAMFGTLHFAICLIGTIVISSIMFAIGFIYEMVREVYNKTPD